MTVVVQHLTNTAFGFPRGKARRIKPVALACIHITGNSRTAGYADLHAAAKAERDYANRGGSNGPSATHYLARDGWTIEAIDWRRFAAWSNGDVSSPNTANPGIRRVMALRAKGYNANEAYWLELEDVGYGSSYPITAAQRQAIAELIAEASRLSGLAVSRETVHGHWEINGVDRRNCPAPYSTREAFLDDVIARAVAILAPPAPPEEIVNSYAVPKVPTIATVPAGTWLYATSALQPDAHNIQVDPGRDMPYLGQPSSTTEIVEYVDSAGVHSGKAYFVKAGDLKNIRPAPVFNQAEVDKKVEAGQQLAAAAVRDAADHAAATYGA